MQFTEYNKLGFLLVKHWFFNANYNIILKNYMSFADYILKPTNKKLNGINKNLVKIFSK